MWSGAAGRNENCNSCQEASNTPKNEDQGWGIIDRGMIAILVKANQEQNELIDDMMLRIDNILNNFSE